MKHHNNAKAVIARRSEATTKQSFGMNVKLLNLVFCNNLQESGFLKEIATPTSRLAMTNTSTKFSHCEFLAKTKTKQSFKTISQLNYCNSLKIFCWTELAWLIA